MTSGMPGNGKGSTCHRGFRQKKLAEPRSLANVDQSVIPLPVNHRLTRRPVMRC